MYYKIDTLTISSLYNENMILWILEKNTLNSQKGLIRNMN